MSRCRLLARTVSGTLSSTWHHPHPPHRHHSHRPDRGVNADGLIRAKRGSSLFQLSTAAFFSASASTSLQSQSQGEAPKAKTNVLVEKLRRFVASTSPSVRALEHVFTLYVPITLSPAASRALADSDFASIASFMIRTAEAHLVVAIPANQSTENEVLDTNESAELDKFQKSISIFKKLWNESAKSATDHAALLSTIASLLGRRMDTSTKLPSIFDSFAKLMLSDIARLRMQIVLQMKVKLLHS
ncbi:hypothetical protein BC830DRAFT_795707 [Chytriomyces sp. MP71]|nr:hypothetical protein BC830DRAFT_795707 [Chytriomyces sp. MP71]